MTVSRPTTLNFITGNKNKLAEVSAILGDIVELQTKPLDLVEIQGTSDEIALDKCQRAAAAVSAGHGASCLVYCKATDDSNTIGLS
jgi:inosine/xanthosine triphosphate pyrophosphatase family protein